MNRLSEHDFLDWIAQHGMGLDPRWPQSAVLTFVPDPDLDRFWCTPPEPHRRPHFLASMLKLMGEWRTCYVWRHLGSWPDAPLDRKRVNDRVEIRILRGLGLPLGTADVLQFANDDGDDLDTLLTLLLTTTIFGWSVGQDLYVVPDSAACILKVSHHEVVHAKFREAAQLDDYVTAMDELGFPLPDEPPDPTVKWRKWMPKPKER